MKRTHLLPTVLIALACSQGFANPATPIIVEDRGGASALHYYEAIQADASESVVKDVPPLRFPADETSVLPIVSESLSPGPVEPRTINAEGLSRPFVLVGSDELSIRWLQARLPVLLELNAIGLAVSVPDADALANIRSAAPGLDIYPVPGDDLAQRLNLRHYPALITSTAIEQ